MHTPPSTFSAAHGRIRVTVSPDPPASVYVTHDGVTQGDIDDTLAELTWHIPALCCVIVLPHGVWWAPGPEREGEER